MDDTNYIMGAQEYKDKIFKKANRGTYVCFIIFACLAGFMVIACLATGGFTNRFATSNIIGTIAFAAIAVILGVYYNSKFNREYGYYYKRAESERQTSSKAQPQPKMQPQANAIKNEFCPGCGRKLTENEAFCGGCGRKV